MAKRYSLFLSFITVFLFSVANVQAEAVLTVVKAEIVPDFPQPGGYVKVNFTVRNIGDSAVPGRASLGVDIYSCNKNGARVSGDNVKAIPWYTNNINPLPPSASQVISVSVKLNKEGYHTASAVIISEGYTIDQLRVVEGDNKKMFYVSRPADLVLESVRLNHQGRLILRMYNAGAAIPDEYYETSRIRVKVASGTYTMPLRRAAGRSIQLPGKSGFMGIPKRHTYTWKPTGESGFTLPPNLQHKVEANIDYNQSILDNKRFNNSKTVWVGGKPDLVVCFKKFNHNRPHRNAWYPPVVKNIGYARSKASRLRFWIKDDGTKTYRIPPLDPGQEYKGVRRRVYWIRTKSHRFRLTADFGKDVDELAETNNIIEGVITVGKYGNNSRTLCSDAPGMTGWN
ncbi:MAG: hypothetical protein HKN25_10900 [Pyrinomonadaceae bacterium]|nr:hypothetical protein [Pyrinomonadaceae bacterium]